jgi:hypothetical protein
MTDTPPSASNGPASTALARPRIRFEDRKLLLAAAVTLSAMIYVAVEAWGERSATSLERPHYGSDLTAHIVLKADDRRSISEICRSFDIPPERYCRISGPCRAASSIDLVSGMRTVAVVLQSANGVCP